MEIGSYTHQNHCILDGAGIFPCSSVDIQVATLRFVATKIVGCLGASQPLQVRNTQACPCQTLVTYQTLDQQQAPVEQICNKQNMLHYPVSWRMFVSLSARARHLHMVEQDVLTGGFFQTFTGKNERNEPVEGAGLGHPFRKAVTLICGERSRTCCLMLGFDLKVPDAPI